jgi:hypothetical protein
MLCPVRASLICWATSPLAFVLLLEEEEDEDEEDGEDEDDRVPEV